jgi:AcrR family transcriptional regulator
MGISTTRRTQADRSATTKAALADGAIDLLVEKGWAATTVIEVCNRVGVSRGAFHHHYDSLPELLADALRRLYAEMARSKQKEMTEIADLVDVTWKAIGNPRFKAVLEAWLAMANDPSLRPDIGQVVSEFASLVNPDNVTKILTDPERRDFFVTARESMIGLALGRATNGGKPLGHERRVLARIRAEASTFEDTAH